MDPSRSLHFSDRFVISCGTVALDLQRSKLLVIRSRITNEYLLPKGRKDIGEELHQTALRETFEETGHTVHLLPLPIPTLATTPGNHDTTLPRKNNNEPIALTQRTTPDGKLKVIFWFAAEGDSSTPAQKNTTQQEDEDFEAAWIDIGSIDQILSFDDDKEVAARVVNAAGGLLAVAVDIKV